MKYLTPCMAIWTCLALAPVASAHIHRYGGTATGPGWQVALDAQAFISTNLQVRKFTDFYQVESPNWFMAAASRGPGSHRLAFTVMASLEPFTLRRFGSAQAFQTGETLDGAPLIDYQHPHDLIMGVTHRFLMLEASASKGREPDEDRLDLDLGVPDSWAARLER